MESKIYVAHIFYCPTDKKMYIINEVHESVFLKDMSEKYNYLVYFCCVNFKTTKDKFKEQLVDFIESELPDTSILWEPKENEVKVFDNTFSNNPKYDILKQNGLHVKEPLKS